MPGALAGLRIVDLTNIILGPYGTMLLADQGADVIKVEAPEGDAVRHIGKPAKTPGMGPTYLYVNRNKRSLCLDLKDKAAREGGWKWLDGTEAFKGLGGIWRTDRPNDKDGKDDYASLRDERGLDDDSVDDTRRPLCMVLPP